MADTLRKITVDEVVESAAAGVLRALDARRGGRKAAATAIEDLVKSGFLVEFHVRAGGSMGPGLISPIDRPLPPIRKSER